MSIVSMLSMDDFDNAQELRDNSSWTCNGSAALVEHTTAERTGKWLPLDNRYLRNVAPASSDPATVQSKAEVHFLLYFDDRASVDNAHPFAMQINSNSVNQSYPSLWLSLKQDDLDPSNAASMLRVSTNGRSDAVGGKEIVDLPQFRAEQGALFHVVMRIRSRLSNASDTSGAAEVFINGQLVYQLTSTMWTTSSNYADGRSTIAVSTSSMSTSAHCFIRDAILFDDWTTPAGDMPDPQLVNSRAFTVDDDDSDWEVTGAATIQAALQDDSDTTYAHSEGMGDSLICIPQGASNYEVNYVQVSTRATRTDTSANSLIVDVLNEQFQSLSKTTVPINNITPSWQNNEITVDLTSNPTDEANLRISLENGEFGGGGPGG